MTMNVKNVWHRIGKLMNGIGIVNRMLRSVNEVLRKCWDCVKMNKLLTVNWFIINCQGVYE